MEKMNLKILSFFLGHLQDGKFQKLQTSNMIDSVKFFQKTFQKQWIKEYTVFPRNVVHAPVYETEAMVHAPKVSPNCTFFYFEKIGPFRI